MSTFKLNIMKNQEQELDASWIMTAEEIVLTPNK